MEFSNRRVMKRGSCNFDTIINDDEDRSNSGRSQIRRRRNRFSFSCNYRSHAAAAASSSMLLLLVAALMLPCLSAKSLADPTTTFSHIDTDNTAELTTESTKTPLPPLTPPQLANTTTNQIVIENAYDLSKQENNEIFAILEITPDSVKPKFELSETALGGNLEETIRNSVKTEIEMEQNLGSAAILDVLKDIPETEVRQKIAEEILSIDYPQKKQKDLNFDLKAEGLVAEKQYEITVSSTETNNIIEETHDVDKDEIDVSLEKIVESPSSHQVEENIREARNLNANTEEHLNTFPNTESTNIDNINETTPTESSSLNDTKLKNIEKNFDLEDAPSSSDSSSSESNSVEDSANVEVEQTDNIVYSGESRINTGITENQFDLSTTTSAGAIAVKIPEVLGLTSPNDSDSLSIVLDETLSATEPSTVLEDNKLQNFINLEATNDISNADEITISPEQNVHIVIKKQGVDLNEAPIDTIGNGGLGIFTETTLSSVTDEANVEMQSGNTELPIEHETIDTKDSKQQEIDLKQLSTVQPEVMEPVDNGPIKIVERIVVENDSDVLEEQEMNLRLSSTIQPDVVSQAEVEPEVPFIAIETIEPVVNEHDLVNLEEQEFDLKQYSTVQPEAVKQVDNEEPEIPSVVNTEIIAITTFEPEQQSQTDIEAVSTAFAEDNDFVITLKGSRSVNTNHSPLSNVDETAATLFEAFPPRDAGQTFNDNLAAESSGGIGKALPTISFNNDATNRSGVIIVLCSGTAILFIVILVAIFLISFQRQHGTLDIEMQEQRCGKDNLDEEDAETCIKLLNVELPPATIIVDAEETDECL